MNYDCGTGLNDSGQIELGFEKDFGICKWRKVDEDQDRDKKPKEPAVYDEQSLSDIFGDCFNDIQILRLKVPDEVLKTRTLGTCQELNLYNK